MKPRYEVLLRRWSIEEAERVADDIVYEIKAGTPVGPTGELQDSFDTRTVGQDHVDVTTHVRYWRFVEFGTFKDPEQKFIRNAIERVRARNRL